MKRHRKFLCLLLVAIITAFTLSGFTMSSHLIIPVEGAVRADWNRKSFWHSPWGKSGVHKGIDIFAAKGTPVIASSSGLVLYTGTFELGGNVIGILGPRWRIHYYAHLDSTSARQWQFVKRGQHIGAVGITGNAAGKAPHLHYSIITPIPYVWQIRTAPSSWQRAFYLNPDDLL